MLLNTLKLHERLNSEITDFSQSLRIIVENNRREENRRLRSSDWAVILYALIARLMNRWGEILRLALMCKIETIVSLVTRDLFISSKNVFIFYNLPTQTKSLIRRN